MSPMQYARLPQNIESETVLECAQILESRKVTLFFKRLIDISLSAILGLLLFPVFVIVSIAVACDSHGGVLFCQTRIGRYGVPFKIIKFRTMTNDNKGSVITANDDDRITRIGKVIRKYRIDELPQIINVLKGDMSIIGPRPESPYFAEHYKPDYNATLLVRPGISCRSSIAFANEAQMIPDDADVQQYYADNILPEKCEMNIEYVKNISLKEDIKIAFSTITNVFNY